MTAETDLLPLPEPKFLARRTASGEWLELLDASDWTAEMWVHGTDPVYSADQLRACVAHRTEALRAEVERVTCELMDAITRADKLEEALREARDAIEDWAGYASDYFREKHDLAGDLAKVDALLRDQEEGK